MAHDAQEAVPVGDGEIGTRALGQQMPVGLLSFQRQEPVQRARIRLAFAAETLIRGRPLPLENRVLHRSLFADGFARANWNRRLFLIQLLVGFVARLVQHGVGDLPGATDDRVGRVLERRLFHEQGLVRLVPLDPQALVRLVALRALALVFWEHTAS